MTIDRAIHTLSQSDPIVKLLQEVKLGRMQPTDKGLRAITEAWLGTYLQIVQTPEGLDRNAWHRLDPRPRIEVLVSAGVLSADHHAVRSLLDAFERALAGSR